MPVRYICKKCGHILYEFYYGRDSRGLPTPSEVIAMHGRKCPKCGRKLEKPSIRDITVKIRREEGCQETKLKLRREKE